MASGRKGKKKQLKKVNSIHGAAAVVVVVVPSLFSAPFTPLLLLLRLPEGAPLPLKNSTTGPAPTLSDSSNGVNPHLSLTPRSAPPSSASIRTSARLPSAAQMWSAVLLS